MKVEAGHISCNGMGTELLKEGMLDAFTESTPNTLIPSANKSRRELNCNRIKFWGNSYCHKYCLTTLIPTTCKLTFKTDIPRIAFGTKTLFTLAARNKQALTGKVTRVLSEQNRDLFKGDVSFIITTIANPKGRRTHMKILKVEGK